MVWIIGGVPPSCDALMGEAREAKNEGGVQLGRS